MTGTVDLRGDDPDPLDGQELLLAEIVITDVVLDGDPSSATRPLRSDGDLHLAPGTLRTYLPVDVTQADEITRLSESRAELHFVLLYHNLSTADWSPWQVSAIAQSSDQGLAIVHPTPPNELSTDLAAAFGGSVESVDQLGDLVRELRSSFAASERDGTDRIPGPLESAILARRAAVSPGD